MKRLIRSNHIRKFKVLLGGLLYALISIVALILCLSEMTKYSSPQPEILLPFGVAMISMILGIHSMFGKGQLQKEHL
ncbi:hypothetical protein H0486_09145 [Lachnospiraceae bacterium MD1]|jgi:hypothetical protein|uniref:Uncharacterized protein n=1 Tax=Variimorphobacter saccharofermentans TaxID=2755051 RepID=A0A839JZD7_9FIRM|nr:hypothetical protein [Variimorphobacter saccharofermentans]MBB2183043.1 hypothetical protein [Variimorphobacter saccharofermentans]